MSGERSPRRPGLKAWPSLCVRCSGILPKRTFNCFMKPQTVQDSETNSRTRNAKVGPCRLRCAPSSDAQETRRTPSSRFADDRLERRKSPRSSSVIIGTLPIHTLSTSNLEWAGFVVVGTFLNGGLAIIRRDISVSNDDGEILGRVRLDPIGPVDEWQPSRKVIEIIKELQREGRL